MIHLLCQSQILKFKKIAFYNFTRNSRSILTLPYGIWWDCVVHWESLKSTYYKYCVYNKKNRYYAIRVRLYRVCWFQDIRPILFYLYSFAVIRFELCYWTLNVTDFQCMHKRKYTPNVNMIFISKSKNTCSDSPDNDKIHNGQWKWIVYFNISKTFNKFKQLHRE